MVNKISYLKSAVNIISGKKSKNQRKMNYCKKIRKTRGKWSGPVIQIILVPNPDQTITINFLINFLRQIQLKVPKDIHNFVKTYNYYRSYQVEACNVCNNNDYHHDWVEHTPDDEIQNVCKILQYRSHRHTLNTYTALLLASHSELIINYKMNQKPHAAVQLGFICWIKYLFDLFNWANKLKK